MFVLVSVPRRCVWVTAGPVHSGFIVLNDHAGG